MDKEKKIAYVIGDFPYYTIVRRRLLEVNIDSMIRIKKWLEDVVFEKKATSIYGLIIDRTIEDKETFIVINLKTMDVKTVPKETAVLLLEVDRAILEELKGM